MTEIFCHSFSAITCANPSMLTILFSRLLQSDIHTAEYSSGLPPSPVRFTFSAGYCLFLSYYQLCFYPTQ